MRSWGASGATPSAHSLHAYFLHPIYTRDGRLAVTVIQEGVIRVPR